MTTPGLPYRDEAERVPSAWTVCPRCGGAALDWDIHQQWHDVLEDWASNALTLATELRGRIEALETDVADLKVRVANLELL